MFKEEQIEFDILELHFLKFCVSKEDIMKKIWKQAAKGEELRIRSMGFLTRRRGMKIQVGFMWSVVFKS